MQRAHTENYIDHKQGLTSNTLQLLPSFFEVLPKFVCLLPKYFILPPNSLQTTSYYRRIHSVCVCWYLAYSNCCGIWAPNYFDAGISKSQRRMQLQKYTKSLTRICHWNFVSRNSYRRSPRSIRLADPLAQHLKPKLKICEKPEVQIDSRSG